MGLFSGYGANDTSVSRAINSNHPSLLSKLIDKTNYQDVFSKQISQDFVSSINEGQPQRIVQ